MLEIQTNQLKTRKKVLIDDHPYTVRKLGAGEELALSQTMRRLRQIGKKETAKSVTDEEEEEALRLANKVMDTMASCFDDGADGKKSKQLVSQLSADELKAIYDQIFEEKLEVADATTSKTKT